VRALFVALTVGCSYPDFAFEAPPAVDSATVDSTAPDTIVDAPCDLPIGSAKHACANPIPRFTGEAMCGVTATFLDVKTAAAVDPTPLSRTVTDRAEIRAAWTAEAFHVRARVFDANISVVPLGALDIYNGDSVEVFLAPNAPSTGRYADDHGIQIDVSPPSGTIPARSVIYLGSTTKGPADPAIYSARLTDDGYEIELMIPWALVGGAPPTAGSTIAVDFAVNDDDDPEKPDHVWYAMEKKAVTGSTPCGASLQPSCDTRTFCTTTLSK
jgi:hypothetical protein